MFVLRSRTLELLRRFAAAGTIGVVLALTVFAASPDLHDELHAGDHEHTESGDTCAIALFAGGVEMPAAEVATPHYVANAGVALNFPGERIPFATSGHLLPPERGPPARA